MSRALDLQGNVFNRLTVLERSLKKGRHSYWLCICSCGKKHIARQDGLIANAIKSCGCLRNEVVRKRSLKHGASIGRKTTKEYKSWLAAKDRCYNPNSEKYHIYGARGIVMHSSWVNDFATFFKHMGQCPSNHTLDRIKNDGNYEPGNCRWATIKQQSRNTSVNVWISYKGITMIEADWARYFNMDKRNFNKKWKRGLSIEQIEKGCNRESLFR